MPNVSVKLGPDPDNPARKIFRVLVKSEATPKAGSSTDIDPGKASNASHLRAMIHAAGAACAEWLNEHKDDHLDPPLCGRQAEAEMERELLLMAELATGVEVKLAKLKAAKLQFRDGQIFDVLDWKARRGIMLTPNEVNWIDVKLVDLSRSKK